MQNSHFRKKKDRSFLTDLLPFLPPFCFPPSLLSSSLPKTPLVSQAQVWLPRTHPAQTDVLSGVLCAVSETDSDA